MKILVISPSWLGDALMSQSVLMRLHALFPMATIDVLTPAPLVDLFQKMREVHHTIVMPVGHGEFHFLRRWRIAQTLKSTQYDRAYVLPNSWKSALIPFLAGIPVRVGYVGEMRYGLLNRIKKLDQTQYPLMVSRYAALAGLGDYPIPQLTVDLPEAQKTLDRLSLSLYRPVIVLSPGAAFGPAKRWPAHYFAALATATIQAGDQVWIIGAPSDQESADAVAHLESRVVNLCGKTTLTEMIHLLSVATAVVSNDSGPMHVAAALNRPLVAIFGASSPSFTPPLSNRAIVLENKTLACHPCFKSTCRFLHYQCLSDIMPERVLSALEKVKMT